MRIIKHLMVSLLVLCFVVSLAGLADPADEQKKKQEKSKEDQQKLNELVKKHTTPGEKHKFMQYFVGEWQSIQKIWPTPGAEPITLKQEITVESLFGGLFTKARIKIVEGELMGRKDAEGWVINGYDTYREKFIAITFGNLGTRFSTVTGTLDETGKTRIDIGEEDNILTGDKIKTKAVTTIINKDKYLYEYYRMDPKGKKIKLMEIIYFRKK